MFNLLKSKGSGKKISSRTWIILAVIVFAIFAFVWNPFGPKGKKHGFLMKAKTTASSSSADQSASDTTTDYNAGFTTKRDCKAEAKAKCGGRGISFTNKNRCFKAELDKCTSAS